jgi:hypothetical protein
LGEIRRSNRGGGWKGSPNSIAALMRSQVPIALSPKCRRCGQLALRGKDFCSTHSGRRVQRPRVPGIVESRMLGKLERIGLLPLELLSLPVWRNLMGIPTGQRAPLRLALVLAWGKRQSAPLHWAQIQRKALDLGAQPGRRQNTAWWYENA